MSIGPLESGGGQPQQSRLEELVSRGIDELQIKNASAQSVEARIQKDIRKRIRFRLMGYDAQGNAVPWEEDVQNILSVEKELVIDPAVLKEEFETIRAKRKEGLSDSQMDEFIRNFSKYAQSGSHAFLNSPDTLFRVRREGWVIIAELLGLDGTSYPVGYNYGLHKMPEYDHEFRMLSKDTIRTSESEKKYIDPEKSAYNWRTGIAQDISVDTLRNVGIDVPKELNSISLRRLGIASALKYLIVCIAKKSGKDAMYFNIGTIEDAKSAEKIRNTPSFMHNIRYFDSDLGYRDEPSDITIKGELGIREHIGNVRWRVRGDRDINDVMRNLLAEDSVLATRNWKIEELAERCAIIFDQLKQEGHFKE